MRIIVPLLGAAVGWWLVWLLVTDPATWPYLVAYFLAGAGIMLGGGWIEEALGYRPAARPEEDLDEIGSFRRPGRSLALASEDGLEEVGRPAAGAEPKQRAFAGAGDVDPVAKSPAGPLSRVSAELH